MNTAIDNFPESDLSILPLLVKIVNTDDNLDVVVAAFKRFSSTTKQNIEFPDRDGLNYWWSQNKDKFK